MDGDFCKLCKNEAELKYSHILPEFLYGKMYDEIPRASLIASDEKEIFIQKGVREYLLCGECETKFSRYEGYVSNLIKDVHNFMRHESGKFIYREGVDYAYLKLFQLSLLWRASVSSERMFKAVELGKHEEIIRKMLYEEDPGKPVDYGCLMITIPICNRCFYKKMIC